MEPEAARERLDHLRIQAYTSVLRCLRDKSLSVSTLMRETIQTKLRLEFGITPEQHAALLAQAVQDDNLYAAAPSHPYAPPAPKPAAIRKQPSKGPSSKAKAAAVMDLNAPLAHAAVHTVPYTYVPTPIENPADRKKRVQEMNYRKVKRWWPDEGGWWDCVISKYNPETGTCDLVYNLDKKGTPIQSESYNLHASTLDHCKLTDDFASAAEIKKLKNWS